MEVKAPSSVLFIDHVGVIGGAERSLIDLSTELSSGGIRCSFIVPAKGELSTRLSELGDVYIVRLDSWRWWEGSYLKLILSLPFQLVTVLRLAGLIRKIRPEVIHFNINRLVEPLIAGRIAGVRSVMHFRDIPSRIENRFLGGRSFFYSIMNMVGAWIANSRATYLDILLASRVPVFHIPNGIDAQSFIDKTQRPVPLILKGKWNVLMIASLTPWKNIEGYIKLAAYVSRRLSAAHFYIAGEGSNDYKSTLLQLARESELDDKLTFLGRVEEIPSLLSHIDILVHTTIREPFGRVFVEAMLASKPVITFRGGGADEVIEDGKTGFLFEEGRVDEMGDKVMDLLNDERQRTKLGKAGFERAVRDFSLDRHVESVVEVYKTLK